MLGVFSKIPRLTLAQHNRFPTLKIKFLVLVEDPQTFLKPYSASFSFRILGRTKQIGSSCFWKIPGLIKKT